MTVGDLLAQLQQYDPTLPVVLSRDGEGNEYRGLAAVELAHGRAERSSVDVMHPDDYQALDPEDQAHYTLHVTLWPN